jgi:hypothetical protein
MSAEYDIGIAGTYPPLIGFEDRQRGISEVRKL